MPRRWRFMRFSSRRSTYWRNYPCDRAAFSFWIGNTIPRSTPWSRLPYSNTWRILLTNPKPSDRLSFLLLSWVLDLNSVSAAFHLEGLARNKRRNLAAGQG